jgi:putative transposase
MATKETARPGVPRLIREHDLLGLSRSVVPRGPRSHDGTTTPATVDTLPGTGLTTTITGGGQVAVFAAVGHRSAGRVGVHAAPCATRFEALEPIRQGVRRNFGGFARGVARGLALRHDDASRHMADACHDEFCFAGIENSPAFARAPAGNGCRACR